jgi:hypothetical protein
MVQKISVEEFISLFYKTFSGFNCFLRALVSSKTKAKDFFLEQIWLQSRPFSAISFLARALQSVVFLLFFSQ